MHAISAEEWQLLAFFEIEPVKAEADVPWPYDNFTYHNKFGELQVTFSVAPFHKDFTLVIEREGVKEIELSALSVFDIRYHKDRGSESLEILVTLNDRLDLRLKPAFSLTGRFRPKP